MTPENPAGLRAALLPRNPCWCYGPWYDVEPGDRPETTLERQHEQGSEGCEYPIPKGSKDGRNE